MNLWCISNFEIFLKKHFLYLFDRNYQILQNSISTTKSNFWHRIYVQVPFLICVDNLHLVFIISFFFSLISPFISPFIFLLFKSNIHTRCGTWSHLGKGPYKIISGQKYEFVMYFKFRDFFEKKIIPIWQKS